MEKLLKEHRENQDLVRSIGGSHYQIVFPVQLRHREKMGISTREIGAAKVLNKLFFLFVSYFVYSVCWCTRHLIDSLTVKT